jgi:hypothetical protein
VSLADVDTPRPGKMLRTFQRPRRPLQSTDTFSGAPLASGAASSPPKITLTIGRSVDVEGFAALFDRASLQWNHPGQGHEAGAQAGNPGEDPLRAADHMPCAHVVL